MGYITKEISYHYATEHDIYIVFQKWCEPSSSLTIFYWKLHILSFTIHLLRISISHGHVSFSAGKIVIPLQRDIYMCVCIYINYT